MHKALVVAAAFFFASAAAAQEDSGAYRTSISMTGGLSVGSSRDFGFRGFGLHDSGSGAAVGGAVAHDVSPRVTLEATGLYLDRSAGAWSADLGVRLNLLPSARRIVPYFAASGGVYSERFEVPGFDLSALRGELERVRNTFVRRGFNPGSVGRGFPIPIGTVEATLDRASFNGDTRHTDVALSFGGGAVFGAGSHVFVRPDARAQMVFSGDTRVLGLFSLNVGYRF